MLGQGRPDPPSSSLWSSLPRPLEPSHIPLSPFLPASSLLCASRSSPPPWNWPPPAPLPPSRPPGRLKGAFFSRRLQVPGDCSQEAELANGHGAAENLPAELLALEPSSAEIKQIHSGWPGGGSTRAREDLRVHWAPSLLFRSDVTASTLMSPWAYYVTRSPAPECQGRLADIRVSLFGATCARQRGGQRSGAALSG